MESSDKKLVDHNQKHLSQVQIANDVSGLLLLLHWFWIFVNERLLELGYLSKSTRT